MNTNTLKAAPQGAALGLDAAQVPPASARALPNLEMPYSRAIINDCDAAANPVQPTHRAFSWLDRSLRHDANAEFVALTRDVSNGVATILQILYRCYDSDSDNPPLLGPTDSEHLLFLATANMKMLAAAADERIDVMNGRINQPAAGGAA